jgi:hypothetical protein
VAECVAGPAYAKGGKQPFIWALRNHGKRTFNELVLSYRKPPLMDWPAPLESKAGHDNQPRMLANVTGCPDLADCVAASAMARAAMPSFRVTGRAPPLLTAVTKAAHSAA